MALLHRRSRPEATLSRRNLIREIQLAFARIGLETPSLHASPGARFVIRAADASHSDVALAGRAADEAYRRLVTACVFCGIKLTRDGDVPALRGGLAAFVKTLPPDQAESIASLATAADFADSRYSSLLDWTYNGGDD